MTKKFKQGEYTVNYESRNHFSVMFQMHGSVWPKVLPYCLANVAATLFFQWYFYPQFMKPEDSWIHITGNGHAVSTFIVSFFVVTRCTMALGSYNTSLANLSSMMYNSREIVAAVSIATEGDQSHLAKAWRNEIAYYTCLLLRLAIVVLNYGDHEVAPWEIPELQGKIKEKLLKRNHILGKSSQFGHAQRTVKEEVFRTPITMGFFLRRSFAAQKKQLTNPVDSLGMANFNSKLDGFLQGYYAQMKAFMAPTPFPMLQIARTLLFLWVFTLPFSLQANSSGVFPHCFTVFFLTYAFLGMEVMSIELEDPFGTDDNDVNCLGMCKAVLEDIYNIVDEVDGSHWAMKVRECMSGEQVIAADGPPADEATPLV